MLKSKLDSPLPEILSTLLLKELFIPFTSTLLLSKSEFSCQTEYFYFNSFKAILSGLFYIERSFMFEQILAICGGISIIGGAGAVIYKIIHPAFKFSNRVELLEAHSENDYRRLKKLEEMQRQQSKCLAAMLNHQITGNGIDNMKKIRDELLESIIEK